MIKEKMEMATTHENHFLSKSIFQNHKSDFYVNYKPEKMILLQ